MPHLAFSRVVTDAEEVVGLLAVVVAEMERRYYRFQQVGARNLTAYNGVGASRGTAALLGGDPGRVGGPDDGRPG